MSWKSVLRRVFFPSAAEGTAVAAASPPAPPGSPFAVAREAGPAPPPRRSGPGRPRDVFVWDRVGHEALATVALFYPDQAALLIRDPFQARAGRLLRWEGSAGLVPLFGDWDGDGRETLGFYDPAAGVFALSNSTEFGTPAEIRFAFGPPASTWIPLVGDWDGDGADGIGLYDSARGLFMLRNEPGPGLPELEFPYGPPGLGWMPVIGDWDGDGRPGVGLYDPVHGLFYLRDSLAGGEADYTVPYGAGGLPLAGDWDGDGADGIALYDSAAGSFHLRNTLSAGRPEQEFQFGPRGTVGHPLRVRWPFAAGAAGAGAGR